MKFLIAAADRETGEETTFALEADTVQDARQKASDAGYLVSEVRPSAFRRPPATPRVWFSQARIALVASVAIGILSLTVITTYFWSKNTRKPIANQPVAPPLEKAEITFSGKALSEWVKLSKDRDKATRLQAIEALGKIGNDGGQDVLLAITPMMSDENASVRWQAAKCYWKMTGEVELPATSLSKTVISNSETLSDRSDAIELLIIMEAEAIRRMDASTETKQATTDEKLVVLKQITGMQKYGAVPILKWLKKSPDDWRSMDIDRPTLKFQQDVMDFLNCNQKLFQPPTAPDR